MPTNRLRKTRFIDHQVQGAMLRRIALYWCVCLMTVVALILCWSVLTGPYRPFWIHITDAAQRHAPVLFIAVLLLPLVLWDTVKLSHRFAGPIYRLRHALRDLADGEEVRPIRLRDDDFWQSVADEFNRVAERSQAPSAERVDEFLEQEPLSV